MTIGAHVAGPSVDERSAATRLDVCLASADELERLAHRLTAERASGHAQGYRASAKPSADRIVWGSPAPGTLAQLVLTSFAGWCAVVLLRQYALLLLAVALVAVRRWPRLRRRTPARRLTVAAGRLALDGATLPGSARLGRYGKTAVIEIRDGGSAFRIGAASVSVDAIELDSPHTFVDADDFEWLARGLGLRSAPVRPTRVAIPDETEAPADAEQKTRRRTVQD